MTNLDQCGLFALLMTAAWFLSIDGDAVIHLFAGFFGIAFWLLWLAYLLAHIRAYYDAKQESNTP